MNKERLKIASEYLANEVNPENFSMMCFRASEDKTTPECKTLGCAIGYVTVLDDKLKTDPNYFRDEDGSIQFESWAMEYFGLSRLEYLFISSGCFSDDFDYTQKQQLDHAGERIDYLIKYGKVPKGFRGEEDVKKFGLGFSKGKRK